MEKPDGILEIFANGIRHVLVLVADDIDKMDGDAFKAGAHLAIEEVSTRLLGEYFDQFEERVRAEVKDDQLNHLAAEFEQVMEAEVLAGRADLIVRADGSKLYATQRCRERGASPQEEK